MTGGWPCGKCGSDRPGCGLAECSPHTIKITPDDPEMNLAAIRRRDRNVIARLGNPDTDPLLRAEMDRHWLLAKVDQLSNQLTEACVREPIERDLWWGHLCPALANIGALKQAQSELVALGADWAEAGRILSRVQSFYVNAAHGAATRYLEAAEIAEADAPTHCTEGHCLAEACATHPDGAPVCDFDCPSQAAALEPVEVFQGTPAEMFGIDPEGDERHQRTMRQIEEAEHG